MSKSLLLSPTASFERLADAGQGRAAGCLESLARPGVGLARGKFCTRSARAWDVLHGPRDSLSPRRDVRAPGPVPVCCFTDEALPPTPSLVCKPAAGLCPPHPEGTRLENLGARTVWRRPRRVPGFADAAPGPTEAKGFPRKTTAGAGRVSRQICAPSSCSPRPCSQLRLRYVDMTSSGHVPRSAPATRVWSAAKGVRTQLRSQRRLPEELVVRGVVSPVMSSRSLGHTRPCLSLGVKTLTRYSVGRGEEEEGQEGSVYLATITCGAPCEQLCASPRLTLAQPSKMSFIMSILQPWF